MRMPRLALLCLFLSYASAPAAEVLWMWSGAVTTEAARVKVKVATERSPALRLTAPGRPAVEVGPVGRVAVDDGAWVLDYRLAGLQPDTAYAYEVANEQGRFRTFPSGPSSFTLALGSCADTASAHPVFLTIARHEPLLFLHTGDFHYEDIAVNDVNVFHRAYASALQSQTQSVLFRSVPVAYMWDDHDFGPNNSDSSSPSREASRRAYRINVPHYPLVVPENGPIHHAFTVGRVRFIMSDMRSERSPLSVPEGPARSMLGVAQKAWLKKEMLAARDTHALIVWVNSVPWIGSDSGSENEDRWTGFTTERAELSAFFEENKIVNLCIVSGDAHMIAIDDGTNNRYGPSGAPGAPVFQAAALDRRGSVKGGPYSHGTFPGPGQFGLLRVTDNGGADVRVELSGRNHEDKELVRHAFTVHVR